MKKLDVPLIRQPENSLDCGIAGLVMLLQYYEVNTSFEELKNEIMVDEVGTYSPQLGNYLIKKGFDVEIITMHPGIFTLKDINNNLNILIHFEELLKECKSERNKKVLSYFIQFLKMGGKINVKIPSIEDIKQEIDTNRPVGALLTSNSLTNSKPIFNFHFNIITGYDDKYVFVNDPMWNERGGEHKYLIQDFFYGLYASAYGDLDNTCLIKVKKR